MTSNVKLLVQAPLLLAVWLCTDLTGCTAKEPSSAQALGQAAPCPSVSESESAGALYGRGLAAYQSNGDAHERAKGIELITMAAEKGLPEAMAALGAIYVTENEVPQNDEKGFEWHLKAANAGYVDSMICVGRMYQDGWGVAQNETRGFEWFRRAAEQHSALAMLNVGVCYFEGCGVGRDQPKAAQWFRCAADLGSPLAMYMIGACYYSGVGGDKNLDSAIRWMEAAADAGEPLAMRELATWLHDRNLEGDRERADRLLDQALKAEAVQGDQEPEVVHDQR